MKQTEFVRVLPHIPHRPEVVRSGLFHEPLELVAESVEPATRLDWESDAHHVTTSTPILRIIEA